MRVCFFGTPNVAAPYLRALVDAGHEVCTAITQPDRPAGRGRELRAPPVKEAALSLGIPVLQPGSCRCPDFHRAMDECRPEVGVVVAYGQILPREVLTCPGRGCVNVHYSLLPRLRGGAPVQHALLQGLEETGVTVQTMVEELDAGDIICQEPVLIGPDDNAAALFDRLNAVGPRVLVEALELVASDRSQLTPQDESRVTWAPELGPDDCRIDWTESASRIHNRIRACSPRPGAFTLRGERRLKVLAAEVLAAGAPPQGGQPGQIAECDHGGCPVVTAGQGALALRIVQPEGKRVMPGDDYARGARLSPGEVLGSC